MMQRIHRVLTSILDLIVQGLHAKATGRLPQSGRVHETPQ